ncbi:MAG: AAA family ATPase, partial [Oscillospiraceae bacterium]
MEKIIMVASGKGGTGKSTFSVFCGSALASRGLRVLLVELDSGLRSVDVIAGVCGKTVYDIQDVLSGKCDGDKAIVQSSLYENLFIISAPYEGDEVNGQAMVAFCGKMKSHFDVILIDTAAGMGVPFKAAASVSKLAIVVVNPDPVCLRDGKLVTDFLVENGLENIRLVINKVPMDRLKKCPISNLDECIDTVCAQLLGVIGYS